VDVESRRADGAAIEVGAAVAAVVPRQAAVSHVDQRQQDNPSCSYAPWLAHGRPPLAILKFVIALSYQTRQWSREGVILLSDHHSRGAGQPTARPVDTLFVL